jgi:hypothetical protein
MNHYKKQNGSLLVNAMKLCERMSATAIEMKMIMRLPHLVEEFGVAYRALREPDQVRALLDIDPELIEHAQPSLHRVVLAAIDAAAEMFVERLDKAGWEQVLLLALEVDDPPENVIPLEAWRRTRAPVDECNGEYD